MFEAINANLDKELACIKSSIAGAKAHHKLPSCMHACSALKCSPMPPAVQYCLQPHSSSLFMFGSIPAAC